MPTATPALQIGGRQQMMQYGVHTETNEDNRGRLSQTVSDAVLLSLLHMVTVKVSNMADMLTQERAENS